MELPLLLQTHRYNMQNNSAADTSMINFDLAVFLRLCLFNLLPQDCVNKQLYAWNTTIEFEGNTSKHRLSCLAGQLAKKCFAIVAQNAQ